MTIKDHVKGRSKFTYYRAGIAYYKTDTGLEFPIPLDDLDGASLLAEEKSIMFMRYISKHLKTLKENNA